MQDPIRHDPASPAPHAAIAPILRIAPHDGTGNRIDTDESARHPRRPGRLKRGLATALALILLMIAAAALRVVPMRVLLRRCGDSLGPVGCVPISSRRQEGRARAIRRTLRRAAALSPWRADCLPQALVAAVLCRWRRVPATVHLGVRLDGNRPLEAHAWVCSGRVDLCGGPGFDRYTPLACFRVGRP